MKISRKLSAGSNTFGFVKTHTFILKGLLITTTTCFGEKRSKKKLVRSASKVERPLHLLRSVQSTVCWDLTISRKMVTVTIAATSATSITNYKQKVTSNILDFYTERHLHSVAITIEMTSRHSECTHLAQTKVRCLPVRYTINSESYIAILDQFRDDLTQKPTQAQLGLA